MKIGQMGLALFSMALLLAGEACDNHYHEQPAVVQPQYPPPPAYSQAFMNETDATISVQIAPPSQPGGERYITCLFGTAVYGHWGWDGRNWYWRAPYCDSAHVGFTFTTGYWVGGFYHEGYWARPGFNSTSINRTTITNNYYTEPASRSLIQQRTTPSGWDTARSTSTWNSNAAPKSSSTWNSPTKAETPAVVPASTSSWGKLPTTTPVGAGNDNKGTPLVAGGQVNLTKTTTEAPKAPTSSWWKPSTTTAPSPTTAAAPAKSSTSWFSPSRTTSTPSTPKSTSSWSTPSTTRSTSSWSTPSRSSGGSSSSWGSSRSSSPSSRR